VQIPFFESQAVKLVIRIEEKKEYRRVGVYIYIMFA
jgi:hypothetical protein